MPLGKLSKKQIKSGYSVLSELHKLLEKGGTSENKIIDATNRSLLLFYLLISDMKRNCVTSGKTKFIKIKNHN